MVVRGRWLFLIAAGAVLALVAGVLATQLGGAAAVELYGVGPVPPIDGDDLRPRFEVAVDHAALYAAVERLDAAEADTGAAQDLTERDRALVDDLSAAGWGGLTSGPLPAPVAAGVGEGLVAVHGAVREALARLDERVQDVRPVAGNRYEVVGAALDEQQLLALDGVVDVRAVSLLVPTVSNDPHVGQQWSLENTGQTVQGRTGTPGVDVGFAETREQADGDGVIVAIVDSGIQEDHPDLSGRFWENPDEVCGNRRDDDGNGYVDDCGGWDFVNHDATPYDPGVDNRHGTHVAGIVAAQTDNGVGIAGLASGATLMPLKVFQGGSAPDTRITAAIEYAVDNGAHVINLSLGGPGWSSSQHAAIARARDAGVLVVVAAGNDGTDNDVRPTYPASYDLDNIIAVGSHANDGSVSGFSNVGATSVDVFAPGDQILSTLPGGTWGRLSGTSMAAPLVTAVAAVTAHSWGTTDAATVRGHVLQAVVTEQAYAGRAVTGGRVSAPLALSGNPSLGHLAATVTGVGPTVGTDVSSGWTARLRGAQEAGVSLDLQLGRWHDGGVWAVLQHPFTITLDGVGHELATDGTGRVTLPALEASQLEDLAAGALTFEAATTLVPARYVLVLSGTTAEGARLSPVAVFFHILPPGGADAGGPGAGGGTGGGGGTAPTPGDGGAVGGGGGAPAPGEGGGSGGGTGGGGSGGGTPGDGDGSGGGGAGGGTGDGPGGGGGDGTGGGGADGGTGGGGTGGGGTGDGGSGGTGGGSDGGSGGGGTGGGGTGGDGGTGGGGTGGDAPQRSFVTPDHGPETGGTWVTIEGSFDPASPHYVHVGDVTHLPVIVTPWAIGIITSPSATGTYDVVVDTGGAVVVAYVEAYTYDPVRSGGGTGGAPPPGGGDGGGAPPPPPGDGGGDGGGGAVDGPGGDADGPAPELPEVAGDPITTDDGMVLDRFLSGPLAGLTLQDWNQRSCLTEVCEAVRLNG